MYEIIIFVESKSGTQFKRRRWVGGREWRGVGRGTVKSLNLIAPKEQTKKKAHFSVTFALLILLLLLLLVLLLIR
jgi:hypothetical protein